MPNVSVVVPIYNVEKYLKRCLESLVNQTLKHIEIILINDASTDNSLTIMREYESKYNNIKVIDSKENLKQGGARNLGVQIAKGDYIGFVDSDDWIDVHMYEKLYAKAMETNSDVVDSDYYVSDGNKILDSVISNTADQIGELTNEKKKKLILNNGRMWTKIFKRELFIDNDIKFPERLFYEDNPVVPLLLVHAKRLEKVNEPLYYYFKNLESTTTTNNSYHHFDRLKTSIILLEEFENRSLYEQFKEEIEYRFSELYYINTIKICLTKFDKPEINLLFEIRNYMKINFNDYRKNKYFNRIRAKLRFVSKINDIQPNIIVTFYNVYKRLVSHN
jgi:glycosyltransferase involved in cell wall biosynthesis